MLKTGLYFDRKDMDILRLVNRVLEGRKKSVGIAVDPHLHPHGIKELVDTAVSRMAYAVVNLLSNLDAGRTQTRDRLMGLRILYDEVINSTRSGLSHNTARVLMQIMKDIVRAHGDDDKQLKLAHDFRAAAQGTPRVVRRLLKRYNLPEMSEEWNQLAFDEHVYDMNTKGRKSPTHLIMDAWIKGLRNLTIIYDNCVDHDVAQEVLEASAIVGITVRIGVEYTVPFRGRFVSFLWIPRGFSSDQDFLDFLQSPKMVALGARGREVVAFKREMILHSITAWNDKMRPAYMREMGIDLPPISVDDFLNYVGRGHANRERLAEYMYTVYCPLIEGRLEEFYNRKEPLEPEEKLQKDALEKVYPDVIMADWLNYSLHPELPHIDLQKDLDHIPGILAMKPITLMHTLQEVNAGYRMVLNTHGLTVEDVMELLWDCDGIISHLEIFYMRDWVEGSVASISEIGELQSALNSGQGPRLKQMIRQMIRDMREKGDDARAAKFEKILINVPTLWERYKTVLLKTRLGTGASNRTRSFGMGLVVTDTLPGRGAKFLKEQTQKQKQAAIPIQVEVEERIIYQERENAGPFDQFLRSLRFLPGCSRLGMEKRREWAFSSDTVRIGGESNLANLGGTCPASYRPYLQETENSQSPGIHYLNSKLTNVLKVLTGFIPAMCSFQYTQEWWFLAWFGPFIWFSITGVRNVLQMVLSSKSCSRGTLMHWRDGVSVNRICDSLMYTGISVLLLELIVHRWFLKTVLGVNSGTNPFLVLTVIGLVNGAYICSHNIYRGFPKSAAIGNLFRALISIPVAAAYNKGLWLLLLVLGVDDPGFYLIPAATVISKMASDTVAGVIEGCADSHVNRRVAINDYANKLRSVYDCYTALELLLPREDALSCLAHQGGLNGRGGSAAVALERAFVVNALDMMYMWYYQPRAQEAFKLLLRSMANADKSVVALSQLVLLREREVSQLMVDGLIGRDFSRPLAFFLSKRKEYIKTIVRLCRVSRVHPDTHQQNGVVFGDKCAC